MDLNSFILIGFFIVILIYSIIIHEVFHGWVALWLGDATAKYSGRLTFNPLKHIDLWWTIILPISMFILTGFAFGAAKPVPYNPYNLKNQKWGPLWVALGGPGSNIAVALLAAIAAKLIFLPIAVKNTIINEVVGRDWSSLSASIAGSFSSIVFALLCIIIFWNVFLAFFNLIPIPPLDGSKLIFALFPVRTEVQILFEQYGMMLLLLFIFVFGGFLGAYLVTMLSLFFGLTL